MPDVPGAATDPDLSVAYRALERRRAEVIAHRDRIAAELMKLDAALKALQALAEDAGPNGQEGTAFLSEAPEAGEEAEAPPSPVADATRAADRKGRVIEFLLENPRRWFTASELASLTEGGEVSATQRNAVSETLRRLLRRGAVHRDEESRPVRYRAVPSVLRELLLASS